MSTTFTQGLNEAQLEAVTHTGSPLLILAGAGSGKTRVLTHKIANLVCTQDVPAHKILAVTFTNKAAGEMRERLARLFSHAQTPINPHDLWVGTFHSIGLRIARQNGARLGFGGDLVVYDSSDQLDLIKTCLKAMNIDKKDLSPNAVASFINRAKCTHRGPDAITSGSSRYFDMQAREIWVRYEDLLRQNQALDFGDLLLKPLDLFERYPDVLAEYQNRFRYIFVDEYQDTNPVQYDLLKALSGNGAELCVVGDEDQSIYRFRGANIRNILDFERDFPESKTIRLEQNYRSTKTILHAANCVVGNNTERLGKTLWSENDAGEPITLYTSTTDREEAAYVVGEIVSLSRRVPLDQIAIFYRTNAQSRLFEEECRRHNLPYRIYGGQNFFERKEVKDIVAYLRLIVNPRDSVSFKRVVNVPARGIGKTSLDRLEALAAEHQSAMLPLIATRPDLVNSRIKAPFDRFLAVYGKLYSLHAQGGLLSQFVRTVIVETGYEAMLKADDDRDAEGRLENLDEFLSAVADYESRTSSPSLAHFLEQITLDTSSPEGDGAAEHPLPMMTLHLAKGLEFPYVFIVGLEEKILPHARSLDATEDLEEERRLLYVGMTRAMKQLWLSHSLSRYAHGREEYNLPSRFLAELPAESIVERGAPRHARSSNDFIHDDAIHVITSNRPFRTPTPQSTYPNRRPAAATAYRSALGTSSPPVKPRVPPAKKSTTADIPYGVGRLVRHPQFGRGVVRGLEGDVDNPKVTILFENVQMKRILGKYAQLEVL